MEALKNFLVVLGSQVPMIGIAVAWWSGFLKNPLAAAGAAVVYELVVFVWGFLGKDVWEGLKPEIVKASTDWIKTGVLNGLSDFRHYRGALPDRRVELYAEICDVLLGHWQRAKGMEGPSEHKAKTGSVATAGRGNDGGSGEREQYARCPDSNGTASGRGGAGKV